MFNNLDGSLRRDAKIDDDGIRHDLPESKQWKLSQAKRSSGLLEIIRFDEGSLVLSQNGGVTHSRLLCRWVSIQLQLRR